MNFESKKVSLEASQQEAFAYLKDLNNYEKLMPENADFSVHESGNGFAIQLKGLPKVGLKIKEVQEPDFILFESPSESFHYEMKVNTVATGENTTDAFIVFDGKFNPMIEMMAKKPLTSLIETIAQKLEEKGLS